MNGSRALLEILDGLADAIAIIGPDGKHLYFNAAARRIVGMRPNEIASTLEQAQYGVFTLEGGLIEASSHPSARALRGETVATELVLRSPFDPQGIRLEVAARPLLDPGGAIVGSVAVFRDVTEHRLIQARLAETMALLDSIVENIPDTVFVKEGDELRFVRVNRAAEVLLARPRAELLGRTARDLYTEERAGASERRDKELLASGGLLDLPAELVDTAIGPRWLHTRKLAIPDAAGRPRYVLDLASDVTAQHLAHEELERVVAERTAELKREIVDRERTQQALRRTEQQLRHAQKMDAVGRLAGGVAHDFNNMLSAIMSFTELVIAEMGEDDPRRGDLREVCRAAERAAGLTRQLLAFSRQQVLDARPIDVNRILSDLDRMLRRLIGEDVALVTKLAPVAAVVLGDPGQLEQVVVNLVVNARDAMPDGGQLVIETELLTLDTEYAALHHDVKPGKYVVIAVSDTGIGMSADTLARIFEPFFTTKELGKGTGLGLSTVYGIVAQTGGHVLPYSELGRGSTFKVYLPLAAAKPEPSVAAAPSSAERGRRETILLVEDEEIVRIVARRILDRSGYIVVEAQTPAHAIELAGPTGGNAIDLLLTDVVMPEMSGPVLADRLRALIPDLPVVYMSGYTDTAIVGQRLLQAGAFFVQKPLTPDLLARKVREALDARAASRKN